MNEPTPVRMDGTLDWLHEQGKRRSEAAPEFDAEETLRMVRIADQLQSPEEEQGAAVGSAAFETVPEAHGGTGEAGESVHGAQPETRLRIAIEVDDADGGITAQVSGELDIATADQAARYLRDVIDSQAGLITVSLAGVTFCDAAGLGVLVRAASHARQSGRSLRLTGVRPPLERIMRITGMDTAFPGITSSSAPDRETGRNSKAG